MKRRLALVLTAAACGLTIGCSKDEPKNTGGGSGTTAVDPAAQKKAEEAKKAAAAARAEKLATLRKKRESLSTEYEEAKAAIPALEKKHAEDEGNAPDTRKLQRYFIQLRRDTTKAESRLNAMRRQFDEVKESASKLETDEIKKLRKSLADLERDYDKAISSWRKFADEAEAGAVKESPVKQDLEAVRLIKNEWFKATPKTRAGTAGSGEKSSVSSRFRAWINQDERRAKVIGDVLKLPMAPRGRTVANYDFTELSFFVLLEIHEADLDRKNIVAEIKGLGESMAKADAIMAKADVVREQLAQKEQAGGGDLEVYSDLKRRLPGQESKVTSLKASLEAMSAMFGELQAADQKRDKEMDEAIQRRDNLKKELAQVTRELRSLGG